VQLQRFVRNCCPVLWSKRLVVLGGSARPYLSCPFLEPPGGPLDPSPLGLLPLLACYITAPLGLSPGSLNPMFCWGSAPWSVPTTPAPWLLRPLNLPSLCLSLSLSFLGALKHGSDKPAGMGNPRTHTHMLWGRPQTPKYDLDTQS
jgi:hypothetical protein